MIIYDEIRISCRRQRDGGRLSSKGHRDIPEPVGVQSGGSCASVLGAYYELIPAWESLVRCACGLRAFCVVKVGSPDQVQAYKARGLLGEEWDAHGSQ